MTTVKYLKKIMKGSDSGTPEEKLAAAIIAVHAEDYVNGSLVIAGKSKAMSIDAAMEAKENAEDFFYSNFFKILASDNLDGAGFKELLDMKIADLIEKPDNQT